MCGIQAVQAAWVPQGRVGVGHEPKSKEQPLFLWALSESVAATVFLLPGDLAPGLMPFSIQRTKASREERHTHRGG